MIKQHLLHRGITVILFSLYFLTGYSQTRVPITGKVTDAGGAASAVSKADGTFVINAPSANAEYIFTYVGFEPLQVAAGGKTQLAVSMALQHNVLHNGAV